MIGFYGNASNNTLELRWKVMIHLMVLLGWGFTLKVELVIIDFSGGAGNDTLDGKDGIDTADYSYSNAGVSLLY